MKRAQRARRAAPEPFAPPRRSADITLSYSTVAAPADISALPTVHFPEPPSTFPSVNGRPVSDYTPDIKALREQGRHAAALVIAQACLDAVADAIDKGYDPMPFYATQVADIECEMGRHEEELNTLITWIERFCADPMLRERVKIARIHNSGIDSVVRFPAARRLSE